MKRTHDRIIVNPLVKYYGLGDFAKLDVGVFFPPLLCYPPLMNKTKFLIVASTIAIILVALVVYGDKKIEPNQPLEAVVDSITTTTDTDNTIDFPSPLTLDSLRNREGWNPAERVEGMWRVEDGIAVLSNSNFKTQEDQIMIKETNESKPSGFTIIHADSAYDYSPENTNCQYYTVKDSDTTIRDCVTTPIEEINELIIISDDTGEVLHKFRLEEGYSLAHSRTTQYDINIVSIGRTYLNKDFKFTIYIYKWNDWSNEKPAETYVYNLNLLTGEVTLNYRR